ncbi:MAG: hypothetical protein ABSB26_06095 [Nitrososphaerales archaeon]|jgi:hypothetical protein
MSNPSVCDMYAIDTEYTALSLRGGTTSGIIAPSELVTPMNY